MKIVTNKTELKKPVFTKPLTVDQVNDISTLLKEELEKHGGIGLSANQLGLDIRACIINVKDPLVLINPMVVEVSKQTVAYVEQCLSIPKSLKNAGRTVRHQKIKINTDNLGIIEFGPDYGADKKGWKDELEFYGDEGLLECVCAQHEIDHLDGILMNSSKRRYTTTFVAPKKYGRNEKVMVKLPDGSTDFMKYKKAVGMLQYGCEIL